MRPAQYVAQAFRLSEVSNRVPQPRRVVATAPRDRDDILAGVRKYTHQRPTNVSSSSDDSDHWGLRSETYSFKRFFVFMPGNMSPPWSRHKIGQMGMIFPFL